MNTIEHTKRQSPLFANLSLDALTALERSSEEKTYRRRQIVFMAEDKNEKVYLLQSGRVKLIRASSSGRELTLNIVVPGELFGETDLFLHGPTYGVAAEVLEDAELAIFPRYAFACALETSIDALKDLSILQSSRRSQAEARLIEYVFCDVPTRIGRLLLRLATPTIARSGKHPSGVKIKLTHQEIANLVGSTRETTTLVLNDFRKRGFIDIQGRRISITGIEALQAFAG